MHGFRYSLGLEHLLGQQGDRLEHIDQVECLGAVAADVGLSGIACYGHHGGVALVSQGDTRGQVDGAGARRGQAGHRFARSPGVAVGHEGRTLLVAGVYELDVVPAVELGDNAIGGGAHQPKDVFHAFGPQRFDDCPPGGHVCHQKPRLESKSD